MASRRGTLLWFNADKGLGAARTDDGEVVDVPAGAFAPGEAPAGRCAGRHVELEDVDGLATRVVFLVEHAPRRARMRHSR